DAGAGDAAQSIADARISFPDASPYDGGRPCTSNLQCARAEACIAGSCGPCTLNSQCDPGQICAAGLCGPCASDTQCALGQACTAGSCQTCGSPFITKRAPPIDITHGQAAAIGGVIYVVGFNGMQSFNVAYTVASNTWEIKTAPASRHDFGAV